MESYEVAIVGAGPAGLSAALVLGRCGRRVILFDDNHYRNKSAVALHGFLTRDGISPTELRLIGSQELDRYPTVVKRTITVRSAHKEGGIFRLELSDQTSCISELLLLATGLRDELPQIPGFAEFYGKGVYHCPYCDGFECRGGHIAVYGAGPNATALAMKLVSWTDRITVCTGGKEPPEDEDLALLRAFGVQYRTEEVLRLKGEDCKLQQVIFKSGEPLNCDALFFTTGAHQRSPLAISLGCELQQKDSVPTGSFEVSEVPGLYVAGDASREVELAIVAAAEGAKAAVGMNGVLTQRRLRQKL